MDIGTAQHTVLHIHALPVLLQLPMASAPLKIKHISHSFHPFHFISSISFNFGVSAQARLRQIIIFLPRSNLNLTERLLLDLCGHSISFAWLPTALALANSHNNPLARAASLTYNICIGFINQNEDRSDTPPCNVMQLVSCHGGATARLLVIAKQQSALSF